MANPEHLAILKQGVEAWNKWRSENPAVQLNLIGARLRDVRLANFNLSHTNLAGADLHGSNLRQADLTRADLSKADLGEAFAEYATFDHSSLPEASLIKANMYSASLRRADLDSARLMNAILSGANLYSADLRNANLNATDFTGSDLTRANLKGASLCYTMFVETTLRGVIGLSQCRHLNRSIIDHSTLTLSDPLPLAFLRGCGLPDALIKYLPSLLNQPIQFYACFISYSAKDQAFAERLHAGLQDKGVRCWFAPEDLKIGDKTRERIDESIRVYDKLLLILSKHSMASQWVEQEVETALRKERDPKGKHKTMLFPIRLDDAVMKVEGGWPSLIRNTRHIGDFSGWKDHDRYQTAFARLLRDLKTDSKPPASDVS
jgi:uncharacterized protein YjbI with pentapeptide repeats